MANIAELVWRSPDHKRCEIHYNNIVRIVSTEDLKGMIKGGYLEVKGWRLDAKGRLIRTPEVTFPRIAPKTFLMIYSNREIMALFEDFSCNSNEDMHYYKSEKIYDKLQEIFKKFS